MNTNLLCPRCQHFIPDDVTPGAYPGAISRVDNKTEICSSCGLDEAIENIFTKTLTPISQWPLYPHDVKELNE